MTNDVNNDDSGETVEIPTEIVLESLDNIDDESNISILNSNFTLIETTMNSILSILTEMQDMNDQLKELNDQIQKVIEDVDYISSFFLMP